MKHNLLAYLFMMTVGLPSTLHAKEDTKVTAVESWYDHFVIGTPDRVMAAKELTDTLSVDDFYWGIEENRPLENNIYSLGEQSFIELLGSLADPLDDPLAKQISQLKENKLLGFAIATNDINALKKKLNDANYTTIGPYLSIRKTPYNKKLKVNFLQIADHPFGDYVPFILGWESAPSIHPGKKTPSGASLHSLKIIHPESEKLNKIYTALGLSLRAEYGTEALMKIIVTSQDGQMTYQAQGALQGLSQ
jgi:hypothetical protein